MADQAMALSRVLAEQGGLEALASLAPMPGTPEHQAALLGLARRLGREERDRRRFASVPLVESRAELVDELQRAYTSGVMGR